MRRIAGGSPAPPVAAQDSGAEETFLIDVAALARRYAVDTRYATSEDIAQDVVLAFLNRIRAGKPLCSRDALAGVVRAMVHWRIRDGFREFRRRLAREQRYAQCRELAYPGWMSPEAAMREREFTAFVYDAIGTLPETCRRAYLMVREEHATYKEVATTMDLSEKAVGVCVASVDRRLRRRLRQLGLPASLLARRGRVA